MSKLDQIKSRIKQAPSNAHAELIEPVKDDGNVDVNVHVNVNEDNAVIPMVRTRKKRFEETHTRATFYIENELLKRLNKLTKNERGEKTRIVNEALKLYLDGNLS